MIKVNTNWAKSTKVSSHDYSWTHVALHTLSMGCDFSMALYYNYLLRKAYDMGAEYTYEQIQTIKQERLKHTISGVLMAGVLIASAISSMRNNERE